MKWLAQRENLYVTVRADGSIRHYEPSFFSLSHVDTSALNKAARGALRSLGIYNERVEFGTEFITPIITTNEKGWESIILKMLEIGERFGDGINPQTGIHVHVNAQGAPVSVLQNIVKVWRAIESGVYRLSCGPSGEHRGGFHKDAHFCRPLTGKGPLVMQDDQGYNRQCYTVNCLLAADTLEEFAVAYARSDQNAGQHYHTPRYAGLCFHSLFRQGSIELRTPNSTLEARHLLAWVELAQAIIQRGFDKQALEMPANPYGTGDLGLADILDVLDIREGAELYTLEELWNMGEFPKPLAGYRWTHVPNQQGDFHWGNIAGRLLPPALPKDTKIYGSDSLKGEQQAINRGYIPIKVLEETILTYPKYLGWRR